MSCVTTLVWGWRRYYLRAAAYFITAYIVFLFLWLALPSLGPKDDGTNYPTTILSSGKTLSRIYETRRYFSDWHYHAGHGIHTEYLIVEYNLNQQRDEIVLRYQTGVPLRPPTQDKQFSDQIALTLPEANRFLPWFKRADAVFLNWWLHRATGSVKFRARWPQEDVMELWPDADSWSAENPGPPAGIEPMLTVRMNDTAQDPVDQFVFTFPRPPLSDSPSNLYGWRLSTLWVMNPVILIFEILPSLAGIFLAILALAVCLVALHIVTLDLTWLAKVSWKLPTFFRHLRRGGRGHIRLEPEEDEPRDADFDRHQSSPFESWTLLRWIRNIKEAGQATWGRQSGEGTVLVASSKPSSRARWSKFFVGVNKAWDSAWGPAEEGEEEDGERGREEERAIARADTEDFLRGGSNREASRQYAAVTTP